LILPFSLIDAEIELLKSISLLKVKYENYTYLKFYSNGTFEKLSEYKVRGMLTDLVACLPFVAMHLCL